MGGRRILVEAVLLTAACDGPSRPHDRPTLWPSAADTALAMPVSAPGTVVSDHDSGRQGTYLPLHVSEMRIVRYDAATIELEISVEALFAVQAGEVRISFPTQAAEEPHMKARMARGESPKVPFVTRRFPPLRKGGVARVRVATPRPPEGNYAVAIVPMAMPVDSVAPNGWLIGDRTSDAWWMLIDGGKVRAARWLPVFRPDGTIDPTVYQGPKRKP